MYKIMMIIFTPDDLTPCNHCDGSGFIPVDVYVNDGDVSKVGKNVEFICGACEGEGSVLQAIEFDFDDDDPA
jgi:hypothetical protein